MPSQKLDSTSRYEYVPAATYLLSDSRNENNEYNKEHSQGFLGRIFTFSFLGPPTPTLPSSPKNKTWKGRMAKQLRRMHGGTNTPATPAVTGWLGAPLERCPSEPEYPCVPRAVTLPANAVEVSVSARILNLNYCVFETKQMRSNKIMFSCQTKVVLIGTLIILQPNMCGLYSGFNANPLRLTSRSKFNVIRAL